MGSSHTQAAIALKGLFAGFGIKKTRHFCRVSVPIGIPEGIRTPVTAVKGRGPRPLDDGDMPVAGLVVRLLRSLFCKIKGK